MAALVIYIIKWAVSLTLLYSLYGLFLRRETFHSLNRVVLLAIMGVSMVLPLLHFTTHRPTVVNEGIENISVMMNKASFSSNSPSSGGGWGEAEGGVRTSSSDAKP